jgi:SAM-dependent methyltransferase
VSSLPNTVKYLAQVGGRSALELVVRRVFKRKSRYFSRYEEAFRGRGLEIAGPSSIFKAHNYYPVYAVAATLDNVDYSARTRWHGEKPDLRFVFDANRAPGTQIINEAGELTDVATSAYDFMISNHMLEHSANPIKVLNEWRRVVKNEGMLLVVLPHKDGTFDHLRPITPLEHLIEDFQGGMDESDTTHIPEILSLHDVTRDYSNPTRERLSQWMTDNSEKRGAHHHVFNALRAAQMVDYAGCEILDIEVARPSDIYLILRNPAPGRAFSNAKFLDPHAEYLRKSPFASDRGAQS